MKVVSVNVSLPIEVEYKGKIIKTGIFKKPVERSVHVSKHNLSGDSQADLIDHGGENKAVYAYSFDHYSYWQELLNTGPMPYGQFGENLTVVGLDESTCYVGDHLQIGSSLMVITQPRVPCYKLGIRFDNNEMPKFFSKSARTGFYLKVLHEGVVEAGNTIEILERGKGGISVKRLFEAYFQPRTQEAIDVLSIALNIPDLSSEWRQKIERRLKRGGIREME